MAPPSALKIRRAAAKAVIRLDSAAAAPQNPPQQSSSPLQRYEASPGTILGADYGAKLACFEHPKIQIKQKLIAKLGADYPGFSEILSSDYPQPDPKIARQLLDRLLGAAKNATIEKKPSLLLAADAMAERLELPAVVPPNAELQRQLDGLADQFLAVITEHRGAVRLNEFSTLFDIHLC